MYARLSSEILPRLILPHSRILVAISGGPDSIAMGHIIYRYMIDNKNQNISLIISHINHKVREEAEEEAELVRNIAQQWGVQFVLHEFNAKENAEIVKRGFQEASRDWRYERWREDMKLYGCDLLATAHHLGDQAETVLYRLIRGSGTTGLAGIYPQKGNIIRPLLSVSKAEIIEYCQDNNLVYAIDKSNFEPIYDRNRIRIELLPELENKYNDKIQQALGRTAEILRWDEEYINNQVDKIWVRYCKYESDIEVVISLEAWEQPEAILSRLLRRAATRITGETRGLDYKFIVLILNQGKQTGWRQDLPGMRVEATKNGFFFFRRELEQEDLYLKNDLVTEQQLILGAWTSFPMSGLRIGIHRSCVTDKKIIWSTEIDESEHTKLQQPLVYRNRKSGDRMYFKKIGHKAIKKVFQDEKISARERKTIPVIATDELVIWIPGVCRSDSMIPTDPSSSRVYCLITEM